MSTSPFDSKQLARLETVTSHAAEIASKLFTKWVRREVSIRMGSVELVPFGELSARVGEGTSIGVVLNLESGVEGVLLFLYSEPAARDLAALLTRKPPSASGELSALETSALSETGNIVGCAYLNSLSEDLSVQITPGSPEVMHDHTQSILGAVLMGQAMHQNECLFVSVDFKCDDKTLDWKFAFLPILDSLKGAL